jgi:hypothetical protein
VFNLFEQFADFDIFVYSVALVSRCTQLVYLNICGLTRLTERSTRALCANCWYLKHLDMEDVFLMDDRAFWFDLKYDSRVTADEKMLKCLQVLNLTDCSHLTDNAIAGLSYRCRALEKLILKGCDKLTDKALKSMVQKEEHQQFPLCDTLKHLDISFCRKITKVGLSELLPRCLNIEELVLSGIPSINDEVVQLICSLCPTVLRLTFEKCSFITDVSICSIAKHLWLEKLNVNYCPKITDAGIDVLSVICTGLQVLRIKRNIRVTDHAVLALVRNCKLLSELDLEECTTLSLDLPTLCRVSLSQREVRITWPEHLSSVAIQASITVKEALSSKAVLGHADTSRPASRVGSGSPVRPATKDKPSSGGGLSVSGVTQTLIRSSSASATAPPVAAAQGHR